MNNIFKIIIIFLLIFIIIDYLLKDSEHFNNQKKYKIAIITSIYGNYDNLKEQNINNKNLVDWYCFTDNVNITHQIPWTIINTPYHLINTDNNDTYNSYKNYYKNIKDDKTFNMMSAKYYKIKTHEIDILKDYDYYIWVDGSMNLKNNFIDNMINLINNGNELINFKHNKRDNIKDEVELSASWSKYYDQNLQFQYNDYIKNNFTDKEGLFELPIICKKNNDRINRIFDMWWIHNLKYSFQDQISYPYVLWELNDKPDHVIKLNVFDNDKYSNVECHTLEC